ncbi:STN domain-containing protein [Pseudomonas anguilliseptica]|uniref:STN domain-containing protein n=1 Tax=Pseudomonas anguilliseptica TaxID=53406 RepID=UPI00325C23B1
MTAIRQVDFDIAAQALDRAALAFAEQAGIQVFFDSERLQGLQASPLRGRYLLDEGLQQLLRGVPVDYRFTGPAQVTLTRRAEGDVTLQLSPTTVRGSVYRSVRGSFDGPVRRTWLSAKPSKNCHRGMPPISLSARRACRWPKTGATQEWP